MNDSTQRAIGAPIRKRDDRDRCIEALQLANARGPGNLKVPALRRLLEFPKEEFAIVARRIFDAVNAVVLGEQPGLPPRFVDCPKCGALLEAPAPEIQIERLREWQLQHDPYWQWSPRELRLLMEYLKPGDVIVPKYAHSC
ncbi:MAG: hypothetical protein WB580_14520, partial [Candidatus Binataceae bacterium]